MNTLSNEIYNYYVDHLTELPLDKQFHFASRLYLWSGDTAMQKCLGDFKNEFTFNDQPQHAVQEVLRLAKESPNFGSKNAGELRRQYFERYPMLKQYVSVLFRICFMQTIYDINARQLFGECFPLSEVETMQRSLVADTEAIAILSTHAINFLYLYERLIKQDDASLSPQQFLEIGESQYDLENPIHIQLLIYLYTHCIIGESLFYSRSLPNQFRNTYQQMIVSLEKLITANYDSVNLDNKYEFLVCCQMVGHTTDLLARINHEAALSVSDDGHFIIDRHNLNPQITNSTLDKSEHRNVLCIMANTPMRTTKN